MNRFSLNTWSLHELLGPSRMTRRKSPSAGLVDVIEPHPEEIPLVELPALLAGRGIGWVDICHFHIPSTDETYLESLRAALERAGVGLYSLLIDFGSLVQPGGEQREIEIAWVSEWIRRAGLLGAKCARVVAGEASPGDKDAMERAVEGYLRLADVADDAGVRLLTENLGPFTTHVETLLELLDRLDGRVGLVADFGNGRRPGEYEGLERLLPKAESVHAKPEINEGGDLAEDDFAACVRLAERAGFSGPYTLVYRGPIDPWEGIARTKRAVERVIA